MSVNDLLPDIQASTDGFNKISINKVGVREIDIPFTLATKSGGQYNTIAKISSYVNLQESVKGINMSRIGRTIFRLLNDEKVSIVNALDEYLREMEEVHGSDNTYIKFSFKYTVKDKTPLSNITTYEPADIVFESSKVDGVVRNYMSIKTTQMSLCPCSKEMSLLTNNVNEEEKAVIDGIAETCPSLYNKLINAGFGAHNQKSFINVTVELDGAYKDVVYIEDIIDIVRKNASSPTWSVLKREDEKYVTEVSYMGKYIDTVTKEFVEVPYNGGAKFVEDESRDIAAELNKLIDDGKIKEYVVVVNNQESIHSGDIDATSVLKSSDNIR